MMSNSPSNQVCEGSFHLSELTHPEPEEKSNYDHTDYQTWRIQFALSAKQTPPKPVDHPHHWIERIQQPPLLGHHARTEANRRHIEAKLYDERDDIAKIPIFYIERRNPKRRADTGTKGQQDEKRQHEYPPIRREPVPGHQPKQNAEADEEIDERCNDRRYRHDQAREIDLTDQLLIIDEAVGSVTQPRGKKSPRQNPGEHHERIRRIAVRW